MVEAARGIGQTVGDFLQRVTKAVEFKSVEYTVDVITTVAGVEVSPGERSPGRLGLDFRMVQESVYYLLGFSSARAVRLVVQNVLFRAIEDGDRFHLFGTFGRGLKFNHFAAVFHADVSKSSW